MLKQLTKYCLVYHYICQLLQRETKDVKNMQSLVEQPTRFFQVFLEASSD